MDMKELYRKDPSMPNKLLKLAEIWQVIGLKPSYGLQLFWPGS